MAMSTRSKTNSSRAAASKAAPSQPSARPLITKKRTGRASRTTGAPASSSTAAAAATNTNTNTTTPISPSNKWPDLTILCDDGKMHALHSFLTKDHPGLVLFTYPRANTGGCTMQATGLSAFALEAAKLGYSIVGASYDSVKSQANWKAKHNLKCRLLCDTLDTGLLKKIGAHKAPKSVKRSTFIIRSGAHADPVIVEKRVPISPKESIAFVEQYVRANPCAPVEEKAVTDGTDAKSKEDGNKDGDAEEKKAELGTEGKKDDTMEEGAPAEGDTKADADKE